MSEYKLRPKYMLGKVGAFEFIGGAKDGETEGVVLSQIQYRTGGQDYRLGIVECEGDTPFKYVFVHKSLIPKEML